MKSFSKQHRKYRIYCNVLPALGLCFLINVSFANNLGVVGSIYQIVEPDVLEGIYKRLNEMKESGELAQKNQMILSQSIHHILRPKPVIGVTDLEGDQEPAVRYFDPSIILNHDIKNENGVLIARKGTRINPLDTVPFNEILVFVNGDNRGQMQWALQFIKKNRSEKKVKIILVKGNINDSSKYLHSQVYFDQHGRLCQYFEIVHTPTLIYQSKKAEKINNKLMIKEVLIDGN